MFDVVASHGLVVSGLNKELTPETLPFSYQLGFFTVAMSLQQRGGCLVSLHDLRFSILSRFTFLVIDSFL